MILQWESIDYGMGLDPQIWYSATRANEKNSVSTTKIATALFSLSGVVGGLDCRDPPTTRASEKKTQ